MLRVVGRHAGAVAEQPAVTNAVSRRAAFTVCTAVAAGSAMFGIGFQVRTILTANRQVELTTAATSADAGLGLSARFVAASAVGCVRFLVYTGVAAKVHSIGAHTFPIGANLVGTANDSAFAAVEDIRLW